jgi:transcriptional regulator PpsR
MMKRPAKSEPVRAERPAGGPPESATSLLTMAADITLVVDADGIITKLSFGRNEAPFEDSDTWIGRRWIDTVTSESRAKIEQILREVATTGASERRQVNHPTPTGADIPVAYTAMRLAHSKDVVAVGRDLRAISTLQQRLVETQQAMERDYWRLRHVETRYRLLFQFAIEAILVLDATTLRIVDANAAAEELLGHPADQLVGKPFPIGVTPEDERAAGDLLARARALGRASDVHVRVGSTGADVLMSATCFRQDASSLFMVRFATAGAATDPATASSSARLAVLVAHAPDAIVVTDTDGTILSANRAFLDIAQLTSETSAVGHSLGDWVGRPGADLGVLLSMLRKHSAVRLVATAVRGEHDGSTEVEVSAVAVPNTEPASFGFILRDVGRRFADGPRGARDLTRAVEELTGLVGRVAIRDLIRDTTDLVERHFIEAALTLTGDNRTAAAEVLGLSRQSLYVKLRRYGLAAPDEPSEKEAS